MKQLYTIMGGVSVLIFLITKDDLFCTMAVIFTCTSVVLEAIEKTKQESKNDTD